MPGMYLWNSHPRVYLADRGDGHGEVPLLRRDLQADPLTRRSESRPPLPPMRLPLIAHINLARGFRGGERQTELLIRGLAARRLAAAPGRAPGRAAGGTARGSRRTSSVAPVAGNVVAAALALRGADLVHVHEARALQAAYLAPRCSAAPPIVVTRRVQQGPVAALAESRSCTGAPRASSCCRRPSARR